MTAVEKSPKLASSFGTAAIATQRFFAEEKSKHYKSAGNFMA